MTTTTWISCRVSTDEQGDSGAGKAAQLDACRAYANRQAWHVAGEFVDDGVSGASGLDRRTGLLEAIASMSKGDVLLVAKRDRLGRDPIAIAMIEAAIRRKGGRIVSAAGEGTEGDDPTSILMRRIVDAFGEYERLVIKARTRAALQAKRRRGERVGQLPFGRNLANDGVHLVENETELATICVINDLRNGGLSMKAIADKLTALNIPTKKGGACWHKTQVIRLLKNPLAMLAD